MDGIEPNETGIIPSAKSDGANFERALSFRVVTLNTEIEFLLLIHSISRIENFDQMWSMPEANVDIEIMHKLYSLKWLF